MEHTHIFLDAQFFYQNAFDFENKHCKQILALAEAGLLSLLMPEITRREIERQIGTKAREAYDNLNKFRKSGFCKNLRQPPFDAIAKGTTPETIQSELMSQFEAFCRKLYIKHLPLKGLDITSVVDDYFLYRPPFAEGEKKNEFPDAFSALLIKNWCDANSQKVVVISGDKDWAGVSHSLVEVIANIAKFLDRYPDPTTSNAVRRAIRESHALIRAIQRRFEETDFCDDEYGTEINEVVPEDIEFGEFYMLEVADGRAVAEVDVSITFTAEVTGEVPASRWDYHRDGSDETRYLHGEQITSSKSCVATIEAAYNVDDPSQVEIEGVSLTGISPYINIESLIE